MEKLNKWPTEVRLKMIEKSEFYNDSQVYQYGYYDGFQESIKRHDVETLSAEHAKMVEMLTKVQPLLKMFSLTLHDELKSLLSSIKKGGSDE